MSQIVVTDGVFTAALRHPYYFLVGLLSTGAARGPPFSFATEHKLTSVRAESGSRGRTVSRRQHMWCGTCAALFENGVLYAQH